MQPLVDGPRAGLSEAAVTASLDPRTGNRWEWGVDVLNPDGSPADVIIEFDADLGGQVRWNYRPPDRVRGTGTAVAETRREASLTAICDPTVNLLGYRYRIWVDLNGVRWHQGLFVAGLPDTDDDGVVVRRPLELADLTYLWGQPLVSDPTVDEADTDVLDLISTEMQARFGVTPDFGGASALLDEDMFHDANTRWLTRTNRLLEAVGYDQLIADADGTPTAVPLADIAERAAEVTFSPSGDGWTTVAGSVAPMLDSLPNVVRFVARQGPSLPEEGNGWATRINQSTGPASIDSRGGEEVVEIVEVEASDQETLDAIADADAQRWFAGGGQVAQITAAAYPRFADRDVVEVVKSRLGLDGDWLVTGWTLPLQRVVSETAVLMPLTVEQRVAVSEVEVSSS